MFLRGSVVPSFWNIELSRKFGKMDFNGSERLYHVFGESTEAFKEYFKHDVSNADSKK